MGADFLHLPSGKIHYRKWGRGSRLLIAVHGYGADAAMFGKLAPALSEIFTIYAIDLPFHGQSQWEKASYQLKDIVAVFALILKKENANHCSLLGHSFGARIAMKLIEKVGNQVEILYLLSPDGIRTRWLWTGYLVPKFLRPFLKKPLEKNEWFLHLAAKLRKRGLIPIYVERFLQRNLATSATRARLLGTWLSLNAFLVNNWRVKHSVRKHFIKVVVILGERDKILNQQAIQRFVQTLPNANYYNLPSNHLLNSNEVAAILAQNATASPASP